MKKYLFPLFLLPCTLFADNAQSPQANDHGLMQTLVMVAIAMLFFYLILWRPENKRRKEMEAQKSAMKKGDQVVAMGVIGTISKITENTVFVRSAESEIEFLKDAISQVRAEPSAKK